MPNEEITVEDVVDALDHPVYWKIPNNYFTVMSAINRGLPISSVDPDANVIESFLDLAALLSKYCFRANDDRNPKNRQIHYHYSVDCWKKPLSEKYTQSVFVKKK